MKVMGCEAPQVWWIGQFPKSGPRVFKNLDWGSMQSQVGKLSELKSFVNCLSCSVKWRKKFSISLYKIPECPRCFFNSISFSYFVSGDGEGEGKWPNGPKFNNSRVHHQSHLWIVAQQSCDSWQEAHDYSISYLLFEPLFEQNTVDPMGTYIDRELSPKFGNQRVNRIQL